MKTLKLTFILICSLLFANSNLQAQAPEKINYQAVARNLAGVPLVNQTINVKYEIRQGLPTGTVVYAENHTLTTNQFGLFTAQIGGGTPITGTFPGIAWGTSPFYLFVEVDGDTMGVTQLLSVPYALYAKESANGPAGLPGKNSLSLSTPYTGPSCINGGTQIDDGLDDNNDGTLQPLEIDYTYIICNGTNGTNGTNGLPGTNGTNGVDGISIDSTINNNDGTFTIYYSNSTSFTTSDLTGPAGTSGTTYFAGNGISLSGDTISNLGDLDNNPTNEIQILSINATQDTIFLSNGGYAVLPSSTTGLWSTFGGLNIHNNNPNNVGIGTTTPLHKLSVVSNDSVVASFIGTNPNVSAIVVANFNPSAATGIVFFNGVDTTSYIFLSPSNNALTIRNNSLNGNILISADSIIVNQGLILVNQVQNSMYNQTDTIYNYSPSGTIVHVNQGMFLTDSLYVLGNNAASTNWVLANDGFGQAKWTDPSTIVGSVGDNWGLQVVIHDTTLTGSGIAGDSLSVNPNIIPTQTSQLTNNSGFITSPDDADFDPNNELQNLAFNTFGDSLLITNGNGVQFSAVVPAPGQVLSWNGTNWSAANAGVDTDNQNISFNATGDSILIANGNGLQFSTIMPAAGQVLQFDGTNWTAVNLTDTDPTNELQDLSNGGKVGNNQTINISGGAGVTFSVADADSSVTNEIQTLSLVGDTLSISGGNNVNLSTLSGTTYTAGTGINLTGDSITNTAPDQTVVITGAGTTNVTSAYPSFIITTNDNDTSATNELQNLSVFNSPGSVTLNISGGNAISFNVDDSPTNELITSFGVNGVNLEIIEAGNTWNVPLTSLSSATNAWNLTGNAVTNPATNFIGTTDNIPLNFRVNNTKAGRIDSTNNEATFGYNALLSNTSGAQITAIGANALKNNTTGTENTAVGYNTLANVTTVFGNTAVGSRALSLATTNGNSAVGYGALELNVGGSFNTAMGMFSLRSSTSGFNAAFGYYSLAFNTSGGNNTGMGYNVLGGNTTGSNNTAVGYNSGATNVSGANNTLIGANTDVFTNNLINATAIGANTVVAQSNSLILGNGANVGIGTPTPGAKLDVQNADNNVHAFSSIHTGTNAHAGYFKINNAANNLNAINATTNGAGAAINASNNYNGANAIRDGIYVTVIGAGGAGTVNKAGYFSAIGASNNYAAIFDQGNVGIGTGSPTAKLHLEGSLRLDSLGGLAPSFGFVLTAMDAQGNAEWQPSTIPPAYWALNGTDIYNTNAGNVGIGTTTPLFPLEITTSTQLRGAQIQNTFPSPNPKYGIYAVASGTGVGDNIGGWFDATGSSSINYGIGAQAIGVAGTGENRAIYGNASTGSINWAGYFDNGNVYIKNFLGIGTTLPGYPLDVKTSTALRSAYFETNTNSASNTFGIYSIVQGSGTGAKRAGSFEAYNGSGENVGVRGYATGSTATNYGIYGWSNGAGGTNVGVSGTASGATNNYGGYFTASGASSYALVVPSGGGNVGIGTITPTAKLDVAGTTKLGVSGVSFSGLRHGTVTVSPPLINGGLSATFNVTVTGAVVGDLIFFTPPSGFDNSIIYQGANVSAANTVTIKVKNVAGSAVTAPATNWAYLIVRP